MSMKVTVIGTKDDHEVFLLHNNPFILKKSKLYDTPKSDRFRRYYEVEFVTNDTNMVSQNPEIPCNY